MRYRLGVELIRLNPTTAVALQRPSGHVLPIDVNAVSLLQQCTPARTLPEHVRTVRTRAPHLKEDQILALLRECVTSGVLQPVDLVGDARPNPPPAPPPCVSALVIVTADRPDMCRRALRSYLEHCRSHGHHLTTVVVDGSRQEASRRAVASIVRAAAASHGEPVILVDATEVVRFKQKAAATGFPMPVVEWLLSAPSEHYAAGRTRNLALLSQAGSRFVTADDDTLCQVWSAPNVEAGVALVGHEWVLEGDFFEGRRTAISAAPESGADLLRAHAALLGESLLNLSHGVHGPCAVDDACPHLFAAAADSRANGRVAATWSGLAGDAAVFCPYWLLFATGRLRDILAADERVFVRALTSREVRRSVRRAVVVDEPNFMSYCAGLDNRELLPPFAPEGFNEDGLFGLTLRLCDPTSFIAQIPLGVIHDSARPSAYDHHGIPGASVTRLNDFLRACSFRWGSSERVPSERMRALGRHLLTWSRLATDEFRVEMMRLFLDEKARKLRQCDKVMSSSYSYPRFWRDAVTRYHQTVQLSIIQPDAWLPKEYRSKVNANDAVRAVKDHMHRWGEALTIWPDLWQLARGSSEDLFRAP